jgi:hypothetical protein
MANHASTRTAPLDDRRAEEVTLTHHQQHQAKRRVKAGQETLDEIARSYSVSRWTMQRL